VILPPPDRDDLQRTFLIRTEPSVQRVNLAGTFNGWNRDIIPLKRDRDGRTWLVTVPLRPGKHLYKFVLDGEKWIIDPAAPNEKDGGGNVNSVLKLVPPGYEKPARAQDSVLCAYGVRHEFKWPYVNVDRGRLSVSVRTRRGDVRGAFLVASGKRLPMTWNRRDEWFDYYVTSLPWKGSLKYRIDLVADRIRSIGRYDLNAANFKPFTVPEWSQGRVFYQIFPERFENGDRTNDPPGTVAWNSTPQYYNWFGGDLEGILKRADHLEKLGVGGIYMTPVFTGPSNHGYETTDYLDIASHFGTREKFRELVLDLDRRGIKTVLDGVFNHSSRDFFAFKDVVQREKASPYVDWFYFQSFPVKTTNPPTYRAWNGYESMPKLNLDNPKVREYFLKVPGFWSEVAPIAGWRLDVANEVDPDFWRAFRKTVKRANQETWIVGENWTDGTRWLQGDQWDSQMGYEFRFICMKLLAQRTATAPQFLRELTDLYRRYPPQVSRSLMNLLSSHDVPRFLNEVGKDQSRMKLASAIQLAFPGSPSIYYGEEIAMEGGADPDNRRSMNWEGVSKHADMLEHYRSLIALRKQEAALRLGDFAPAFSNSDGVFGFYRSYGAETVLFVGNASENTRKVKLPEGKWSHLAGAKGGELPPHGWGIWKRR
jgi:cyclomaltodextrinase / maltogenic alpha-amylase / neopullulanase